MYPNLKNFLVFNNDKIIAKSFKTFKCSLLSCDLCPFLVDSTYILLKNYFFIPILSYNNCNSHSCIYLIECSLFKAYYIGQTGKSIKERFNQHIRETNKHINFSTSKSEVALHFTKQNHNYNEHLKFYIIKSNITEKLDRLNTENNFINIIIKITSKCINSYIPRFSFLKSLCFT